MNDAARITEWAAICRSAALSATRTEAALGAGSMLGRIFWLNDVGTVEDEALESALHERHGPSLAEAAAKFRIDDQPLDWLHIITEAYDSGGHTQLLEAVLSAQTAHRRLAVAVTTTQTPRFAKRCAEFGIPVHRLKGSLASRAARLIALGRRAQRIMLHIDPDDLGAAIAARVLRDEGHEVVLLNHADHVFGFGHGAATIVAEVSGFGWRLTAERRVAQAQHFLGIPTMTASPQPTLEAAMQAAKEGPILSIGSAYKYRPNGGEDFQAFLMALMSRTDRQVDLIGPTPEDPWWKPVLARHGSRLRLLGRLSFEDTLAHLAAAACYVDSFPITGGTALTQGLMSGKTIFAPPYPAGGYSLADALRAPSIEAMTEQVLAYLASGKEPPEQAVIRRRIADEFGTEALKHRLARLEQGAKDPPPEEMLAAAQDMDFFTKAWRQGGASVFAVPRQARPGLATRIALTRRVAGRPGIRRPVLPLLLGWTLLGPPPSWAVSP